MLDPELSSPLVGWSVLTQVPVTPLVPDSAAGSIKDYVVPSRLFDSFSVNWPKCLLGSPVSLGVNYGLDGEVDSCA